MIRLVNTPRCCTSGGGAHCGFAGCQFTEQIVGGKGRPFGRELLIRAAC